MDQILIYYAWIDSDRFYQSSPPHKNMLKNTTFIWMGLKKVSQPVLVLIPYVSPHIFSAFTVRKQTNKQNKTM